MKIDGLTGLNILVMRPEPANTDLCLAIRAQQGVAISWPAIAIEALTPTISLDQNYTGVIFVSVHAVKYGLEYARPHLSETAHWLAVGKTTADALAQQKIFACYSTAAANSEALLDLPLLQSVDRQHWLIVRGQGGRECLAQTLMSRGACVDYLEVYRRCFQPFPEISIHHFLQQQAIHILVFTSVAVMQAFLAVWDGSPTELATLNILVVSERMQKTAIELGFQKIHCADSAYIDDIMKSLMYLASDLHE